MNTEGIEKFYEILGLNPLDAADAMYSTGFVSKVDRVEDTPDQAKKRVAAVKQIYEIAGMQLEQRISELNDAGEKSFIREFLGKLQSSIQGEGKLVYVNFDAKGTYNKLNPQLITNLARTVDLGVTVDMESKAVPYIYIMDKISGKPIMHVRLAVLKSGRMTHTFELDYLLDLIQDANKPKNDEKSTTNQQPAANATPLASKSVDIPAKQQLTQKQAGAANQPNKMGQQPDTDQQEPKEI
jgi:hypothetical protein